MATSLDNPRAGTEEKPEPNDYSAVLDSFEWLQHGSFMFCHQLDILAQRINACPLFKTR